MLGAAGDQTDALPLDLRIEAERRRCADREPEVGGVSGLVAEVSSLEDRSSGSDGALHDMAALQDRSPDRLRPGPISPAQPSPRVDGRPPSRASAATTPLRDESSQQPQRPAMAGLSGAVGAADDLPPVPAAPRDASRNGSSRRPGWSSRVQASCAADPCKSVSVETEDPPNRICLGSVA